MRNLVRLGAVALALAAVAATASPAPADVNAGAALVRQNGCQSCHGTDLKGTSSFPALFGIEHRLSHQQIVDAILDPKPPMPKFDFSPAQASDIADYLASLDSGAPAGNQPTIAISPDHPSDMANVVVRFPGTPPKNVKITATMSVGGNTLKSQGIKVTRSPDGRTFTARVPFSMGGTWTVHVFYDNGKHIDQPVTVGQ